MSEYQFYDFQAIDRRLTQADRDALRALSTRAVITSTRFTNSYHWGDFSGDPNELVERWFDLHLYLANWGARRLVIRLPKRTVDRDLLDRCIAETDSVEVWEAGANLIVSIAREDLDIEDWDEEDDERLSDLEPLRAAMIAGDTRLFYLFWLMAVQEEAVDAGELEPLPGLGPLTDSLEAFADFFCLDGDLVEAAAERAGDPTVGAAPTAETVRQVIAAIAEPDKTELLARLHDGDGLVAAELAALVRRATASGAVPPPQPRTVSDLRARADEIRRVREQAWAARVEAERKREEAEAERTRRARLDALIRRGEAVWSDIETEIQRRNPSGYDRAADLLTDLRTIAEESGSTADYARRLEAIRARHGGKYRFMERLAKLG